jgi:hypothetical protein
MLGCVRRRVVNASIALRVPSSRIGVVAHFSRKEIPFADAALIFPWTRVEKDNLGFLDSEIQLLQYKLLKDTLFESMDIQSDEDILIGAEAAFRSAIDGIFSHQMNTFSEGESKEQTVDQAKAHLNVIFESKLSKYFSESLDETQQNKLTLNYSLQSATNYKIIDRDLILGASRSNMFPVERCAYSAFCGVRILLDGVREDDEFKVKQNKMMKAWEKGDLTLRLTIEVNCKGNSYPVNFAILTRYN